MLKHLKVITNHVFIDQESKFQSRVKVIRNCIGFHLLRSVIGLKNTLHFLNQSDAKLLPITTWLPAFAQALGSLSFKGIFFLLIGR